jgi:ectoine hydroxylase-related dioxygenase (phytanoyl-CoA dioxygenase family)
MYWKGSHKVAWEHFRKTPKDYMAQGELSQGQVFEILTNTMETEAVPFSGKAGDLLIWHSLTLHSASVNISNEARLAIFGRWGSAIESNESHFNFSEGIWDKWNLMDSN